MSASAVQGCVMLGRPVSHSASVPTSAYKEWVILSRTLSLLRWPGGEPEDSLGPRASINTHPTEQLWGDLVSISRRHASQCHPTTLCPGEAMNSSLL